MNPFNILWRSFCNTQSLKTFQVEGTQLSKLGLVQRNKSRTLLFSFHQHITSVRNLSLQRTAISNLPLLLIQFPWKSHKLFPSQSSFCKIEVSDSKEKESNRKPGPGPSISIKKGIWPSNILFLLITKLIIRESSVGLVNITWNQRIHYFVTTARRFCQLQRLMITFPCSSCIPFLLVS